MTVRVPVTSSLTVTALAVKSYWQHHLGEFKTFKVPYDGTQDPYIARRNEANASTTVISKTEECVLSAERVKITEHFYLRSIAGQNTTLLGSESADPVEF